MEAVTDLVKGCLQREESIKVIPLLKTDADSKAINFITFKISVDKKFQSKAPNPDSWPSGGKPITPTGDQSLLNGSAPKDSSGDHPAENGGSTVVDGVATKLESAQLQSSQQQQPNGTKSSPQKGGGGGGGAATAASAASPHKNGATGQPGQQQQQQTQVSNQVIPGPQSASHVVIDEKKKKKCACCVIQ
ncbi:uncharacterized protein LOC128732338 [Sabethes cyaneus]|uniref:uncharacterized protein LOC128732338 n=1 Tax=Sabethes cyaneus TaxID=53552 RepID=UPI00237D6E23|nr:uncharacterized protein LOC128732338 [Sabethes cyaneus]